MTPVAHPGTGTGPEDSHEPSPRPLEDEIAASRPEDGGRFNAARFEVRLRRWALLLLVTAPAVWFLVQQLR